jgi:8-oxo-dGTP pyrophosphatase MutT (NUDIX family)
VPEMKAIRYQAAGGVVIHSGHVHGLQRPSRDEIRLPKGHLKKGESPQEAALREVREESGYADLAIVDDLGEQTVAFDLEEAHVVRDECYFLMRLGGPRQVDREPQEDQFIPQWMDPQAALEALTFEAEKEWLRRALESEGRADGTPNDGRG